jgi:hypothetical protein
MQDIRLMAGEGKLTKKTVLQAIAVIRKQRRPKDVAESYDNEELANEVYAEFERIYPNLARRANERTVHAAIMDVLNYGGDSNPSALAQDVARAVKRDMQQGMAEGAPIVVAQAPIHIRNPKIQQSRQEKPLTAYQQGVAAQGKPYQNPHQFDPKAGADVNYDHNQYRAGYKKQGVAEAGYPEVDHMPGAVTKRTQTGCKRCNGKGYVYKTPDGQVHNMNRSDAKTYKCSKCDGIGFVKVAEGKEPVSEMTAGGCSAGGFATGPTAGGGKPGTGKPNKIGNILKRTTPKVGKGIY